jgi:hypothetical protein
MREGSATLVSIPLGVLILLIWIAQLATLADLNGSDPAGNALAQAYSAAEIIVLWVLLAVLTIVAWTKCAMPGAAALAALILIPASGLAAITAAELLAEPDAAPFMWRIIIPAVVPPLIIAFCFWALLPLSRAIIPARVTIGVAWGATLILCISTVVISRSFISAPSISIRQLFAKRGAACMISASRSRRSRWRMRSSTVFRLVSSRVARKGVHSKAVNQPLAC